MGKGSALAEETRVVRSVEWTQLGGHGVDDGSRGSRPHAARPRSSRRSRAAASRGLRVKAIGAGHSFTGVAVTDGLQLRLGALSGVTTIDATRGEATVRAGTPLHVLNEELAAFGYALPNLGDIDRQSIAGAIATGTHGTGLRLTGLSGGVRALRLVLADGSVVELLPDAGPRALPGGAPRARRARHHHRADAGRRAGLPAPRGRAAGAAARACWSTLDDAAEDNDHFEFYWYPHTDRTQTKRNNRVPAGTAAEAAARGGASGSTTTCSPTGSSR